MQPFNRAGTFRGRLSEWAVNTTKNGFPQFVTRLQATEYFDETGEFGEAGAWVSWAEYEMEITGYLCLFGGKGPCLAYEQCKQALGWAGETFTTLNDGDWSNSVVQFRVEERTYEGNSRLQVTWLDAHDADPGRSIKKLDAKGLAELTGKWKDQMAAKSVTPRKVGPPTGCPTPPPRSAPEAAPESSAPEPSVPSDLPASTTNTPESSPPSESSTPPKKKRGRPAKQAAPSGTSGLPSAMTKQEAWEKVVELKTDKVTDDALSGAWVNACKAVAPTKTEDTFTPEDWAAICNQTLDKIDHIDF